MPCLGFFGSNSQRYLTFPWPQSMTEFDPSPLATQAIWFPQNLARCCVLSDLSSSFLTWNQTQLFLIGTSSLATRTDTGSLFTHKMLLLFTTNIYRPEDSQIQVNSAVRNSPCSPDQTASFTKQGLRSFVSWPPGQHHDTCAGPLGLHLLISQGGILHAHC